MHERLAQTYEVFGRRWAHGTSPLYEEWAVGIAGDADLLALLAGLPDARRQPNLVFAAARWAGCPLTRFARWQGWLGDHWPEVARIALERTTQTNEPNRCATLLPALSRIPGPIALLEAGAAAGLCLLPDRYGYRYDTDDGPVERGDGPRLRCRVVGPMPEVRIPEVVWRRGIDLDPIDPADPEAIRWLETLVWPGPDHDARVGRLRGAAALAASDPSDVVRGDLLARLEDVAATSPADATLVVFHSAVMMYLDAGDRDRFVALVQGLGDRIGRRVVWISQETSSILDLDLPVGLDADGRFVQAVDGVPVALAGQHGATYERLADRGSVATESPGPRPA